MFLVHALSLMWGDVVVMSAGIGMYALWPEVTPSLAWVDVTVLLSHRSCLQFVHCSHHLHCLFNMQYHS